MIEILKESSGKVVGFSLSGKLHDEDYETFIPQMERVIDREGKARLLTHFHDFHGWDLHAAWDDTAFAAKHYGDIERIALVGDRTWEKWMAKVCKPFTKAAVEYFDADDIQRAWAWLREAQEGEANEKNSDDQKKNTEKVAPLKEQSSKSVNELIADLGNADGIVRMRARQSLVDKGDSVADDLVQTFQKTSQPLQLEAHFEAAKALSQIGSEKAIQCFIDALDDEAFRVRWVAAEGLIAIGTAAIKPLLIVLTRRSGELWIRERAHHVIHDLVRRNLFDKEKTKMLQTVLDSCQKLDADIYLPFAASNALNTW